MLPLQAKRWTERLYREYDTLLYQYRLKLKRPVIELSELESKWGIWDPLARTISLSSHLLETQPWDTVVEVLKHEMAHQYGDELEKMNDGHGPAFQRGCERLGVASWARKSAIELGLPLREKTAPSDTEAKVLAKAEKLLALAGSSNEHEAALAMQRVQELYQKYNLESRTTADGMVYAILNLKRRRTERYHAMIGSILNDYYFVRVIHTTQYNFQTCEDEKAFEILGTPENVRMAEFVFHFLMERTESLWEEFRKGTPQLKAQRRAYSLGVLSGFKEKLEVSREEGLVEWDKAHSTGSGNMLMRTTEKELERYVKTRYPRLSGIRYQRGRQNPEAYHAGKAAGRAIVLRKVVTESQGYRGGKLCRG